MRFVSLSISSATAQDHDKALLKDFYYQDDRLLDLALLQIRDAYGDPVCASIMPITAPFPYLCCIVGVPAATSSYNAARAPPS